METEIKTEAAEVVEPKEALKKETKKEARDESIEEMLASINKNVKRQTALARWRALTSLLALVVLVAALLAVGLKVMPLLDQVSGTLTQVQNTITGMKLEELTKNINELTVTGTQGINQALSEVGDAMEVINGFDIEGLNGGIEKLNDVMEPLSNFFSRR